MRRCFAAFWTGLAITIFVSDGLRADDAPKLVAETDPLSAEEQQKAFRLPEGFEIQLVAAEPAIQKPINLNFDAQGRLWVASSVEYPFPADPESRPPRDRLSVLSDSTGDGVPDQATTFAENLNIPIGVTALHAAALCYSIPNVYRMADRNGDGRADHQEVLYREFGYQDTHGMASSFRWWIDGWVYACHGFANTSTVQGSQGEPITMHSGSTYRLRPDGSRIEHFTHGQVNPFGLAFDPLGNVYSADCHSRPLYMLLRGAYYPSFGKPHDGLGFGPEMIEHSHGSTGIAGVVYYAADQFPQAYRDTVFIGNPVTGRINHDRLERTGSTYRAVELPDFLTCDDPWFRPVDIALAPDGSLYIADFYNRIIGHYEVPLDHPGRDRERGRIWRIVYVGDDGGPRPAADLTQLRLPELVEALSDPNLTVRTWATHQIVERIGEVAVEPVRKAISGEGKPFLKAHGLWALQRLGALDDDTMTQLAENSDPMVRVHLAKALAEREWNGDYERELAVGLLADADAFVRRAAAEALGRHPNPQDAPLLLGLWEQTDPADTHLVHAVRIALRDSLAGSGDLMALLDEHSQSPDRLQRLAEIALGLPTPKSADFLINYLRKSDAPPRLGELLHHAVRHAEDDAIGAVFEFALGFRKQDAAVQGVVLRAVLRASRERRGQTPSDFESWSVDWTRAQLSDDDEPTVQAGLEFVREFRIRQVAEAVRTVAEAESKGDAVRMLALETLPQLDAEQAKQTLPGLVDDDSQPIQVRRRAAETSGLLQDESVRTELLELLEIAPRGLDVSIARGLSRSDPGAEALLAAVEKGKAARQLLVDGFVAREMQRRSVDDKVQRYKALIADLPPEDERIRSLIAERKADFLAGAGDPSRGADVFKKTCAACHQIQGQGAKVGPQLDGVGVRGLDRVLEDVLDPHRNVDEAFRSTLFELDDGQVLSGLVLREEGAVIVLADSEGKEIRIENDAVENRRKTNMSPMSGDVAEKLPDDEFRDLLSFLLAQKLADRSDADGGGR